MRSSREKRVKGRSNHWNAVPHHAILRERSEIVRLRVIAAAYTVRVRRLKSTTKVGVKIQEGHILYKKTGGNEGRAQVRTKWDPAKVRKISIVAESINSDDAQAGALATSLPSISSNVSLSET